MYGNSIGSLKIMRITKQITDDHKPTMKDFNDETIEWEASGNHGNKWVQVELDLHLDGAFKKYAIHWVSLNGIFIPNT